MKKNIEEDVEILEKFSNENIMYGNTVGITLEKYKKLQVATQHILSDYKRVLKENEELKELANKKQWISPCYVGQNYISKQKVKDKVEELKGRKMDIVMSPVHNNDEKIEILRKDKIKIEALQELLESEEER